MSKFKKLSQLNKDIELLEAAGKIKAAEVLHHKFIKEAQYAMPQMMTTMMPQMMMPQMMPLMMPQMMARPMMPMAPAMAPRTVAPAAAARPVVTPAPVQQGQTGTTPPVTPPTTPPTNPPTTGVKPSPGKMTIEPPNPLDNTQRGYGNEGSQSQELQYLQNELKRLQDQYGANCGPFASQCETIKQMIERNKGGSVIKG